MKIKKKGKVNFKKFKSDIYRDRYLYFMLLPFILWYIVFQYVPMYGLQIAFKDYSLFKGITKSNWVGFTHFKEFLLSPYFYRVLKNTIILNVYNLVICFPAPIILAILINEVNNKYFKKTIQTFTYLPHFISIVIVAGIVTNFLAPDNGLINLILSKFGFEKVYFLTKPEKFRGIYTTMNLWKETGFATVVYIAALASIDVALYEAAKIDGAGKWQQIKNVTIPGIMPTVIIMLILKIGNLLEVGYETIILLYQPATYETADVISTYVYRTGLLDGRYDFATAVGLFNSLIALVLVYGANKISKKLSETSLW